MAARGAPILAIVPPPAQYALAFLVGVGLDRLAPWRPAWLATEAARSAGLAIAVAGLALAIFAAGRFASRRTTLNPAGRPARLVVDGAHAWSRNPMYLALTIIYAGVAFALGEAWSLVLIVLPWASMNWAVIPFEEERLREAFASDYAEYCRTVRRWI
jgi:protein-S-isoprenylcysteine O-methyltransferase Ste14